MNKRSRLRFNTDMTARITCLDSSEKSLNGRLQNLSAHGLSIILPQELPEGIMVRIEWGKTCFQGRLIYCKSYGSGYQAGLKVEDPIYDATLASKGEKTTESPR
jgi:hypothetical protein